MNFGNKSDFYSTANSKLEKDRDDPPLLARQWYKSNMYVIGDEEVFPSMHYRENIFYIIWIAERKKKLREQKNHQTIYPISNDNIDLHFYLTKILNILVLISYTVFKLIIPLKANHVHRSRHASILLLLTPHKNLKF